MAKVTQVQIIKALQETGGIVTQAAEKLGLSSPNSLRKRINRSEKLLSVIVEIREQTKDLAELNIFKSMKEGDKQTSIWYLNSQGRDRGYGNKVEIEGKVSVQMAPDLSNLSMEELKQLEAIASKVASNPAAD